MTEQLIAFQTAVLAKEKGFSGFCNGYYYNNTGKTNPCYCYYKDGLNEIDYSNYLSVQAPTQNLLQKWLREIHDIWVEPKIYDGETLKNKVFGYLLMDLKWGEDHEIRFCKTEAKWKTYEEAIEIGLQKGLGLIKQHNL